MNLKNETTKPSLPLSCTVQEAWIFGKHFLKAHSIETCVLDARLLLQYSIGFSDIEMITKEKTLLTEIQKDDFCALLHRRAQKEPVQYIRQQVEFMDLPFFVNKHVLIPRPDTEILVEQALQYMEKSQCKTVLEIGTGSGCISISLAKFLKNLHIVAVDISELALEIAKKNSCTLQVSASISFLQSNLFEHVPPLAYDAIISNPPYIETKEIAQLGTNVKDFEPLLALDGGEDGLYFYRKIIQNTQYYLKTGGLLFLEIGYNQYENIKNLLDNSGFVQIQLIKDYGNLDRVIVAQKGS